MSFEFVLSSSIMKRKHIKSIFKKIKITLISLKHLDKNYYCPFCTVM